MPIKCYMFASVGACKGNRIMISRVLETDVRKVSAID